MADDNPVREFVDQQVRQIINDGGSHDDDLVTSVSEFVDGFGSPTIALVSIAIHALQGYAAAVQGMYDDEAKALDYLDRLAVLTEAMVVLDNFESDETIGSGFSTT
jgi:hypothetical protein